MAGPLSDVRILEFSEIIAAPFAGMLLSDMGADIIKIEPPWGEPWRHQAAFLPLESRNYLSLNRGKKSLAVDLTRPEGREIIYELTKSMDAVVINYRPDTPGKLGIDYETLSQYNPRLIYCQNTAFGLKGPHSYRPGYDIIAQAMTGIMATGGKLRDGLPQTIGATAVADYSAGIAIAWGLCAALYARERTGKGQKVESTLLGAALGIQTSRFINVVDYDDKGRQELVEGISALRSAGAPWMDIWDHYQSIRALPPNAYYRTYQTRDGVIAIGNLSDPLRQRTAAVLGIRDPRFEPGFDRETADVDGIAGQVVQEAEKVFLTKTTQEWLDIFDEARIPAGPVLFTEELEREPQVLANGFVAEVHHPTAGLVRMVGPMLNMSETPLEVTRASPPLGDSTEAILTGLGYAAEAIAALRDGGVIA